MANYQPGEARRRILETAERLGITVTAEFVPFSRSRKATAKERFPSLNWRVTVLKDGRPVLTTDYTAGCARCPGYERMRRGEYGWKEVVAWECEHGRRGTWLQASEHPASSVRREELLPDTADVLSALVCDSEAIEAATFEDWCGDLGYDPDSREAERTYRACLEIGLRLRAGIGEDGLRDLREACEGY